MNIAPLHSELLRNLNAGGAQTVDHLLATSRITRYHRRITAALLELKDAGRVVFSANGLWCLPDQVETECTVDEMADAILEALSAMPDTLTLHDLMMGGHIPRKFGRAKAAVKRLVRSGDVEHVRGVGFRIAEGAAC